MAFITVFNNPAICRIYFFNRIKGFIENSKYFKTNGLLILKIRNQFIKQTARKTPVGCIANEIGSSLNV